MGWFPVDARMPYGDDIETRNSDGRLEHDQTLIVIAQQARRNDCDKIVRLQYLRYELEARHGVPNLAPQLEAGKRLIGWAFEGSACWQHDNMIIVAKTLNGHGPTPREWMQGANGDDIALAVKQPRRQIRHRKLRNGDR